MIHIFWALFKILLGVSALGWLLSNPGSVVLVWQGWRIDTYTSVLVIAVVVLSWGLYRLFRFLWFMKMMPERLRQQRTVRHYEMGMSSLTNGFIAISESNHKEAKRSLQRAERYLQNPTLTGLLAVQTAQLAGDEGQIKDNLLALLDNEKTSYLGLRGLLQQALKKGDWKLANSLADDALKLRPKSVWVVEKSLMIKARMGDFDNAMTVLEKAIGSHVLEKKDYQKRKANLLYHMAQQNIAKQDYDEALENLKQAQKLDSGNVDIVTMGVDILLSNQDIKTLEKWIETLWTIEPNQHLFRKYRMARMLPEQKQQARLKRLANQNRNHPMTQIMMADYLVEIKHYEQAKNWLTPIIDGGELTRKVCFLMADIEENHRQDLVASGRWRQMGERLPEPVKDIQVEMTETGRIIV